ncbi:unnamed protein product [Paramecium sonneborni]|uniref:Uncharacterized protein n=1 Tax=Paramecium sonneborni TaxID=65129 RepID=A0A8S1RR90_9CILI|nr:unnamed protein product [Paramecium sonneborni]
MDYIKDHKQHQCYSVCASMTYQMNGEPEFSGKPLE